MKRSKLLSNRLEEVLLNGQWVANTNYKSQLETISWQQATQKVGNLNTIAHLTFHINYYLSGILNVFNGGDLEIRDQYSFNMPAINSEKDWKELLDDFLANSEKFIKCVESLQNQHLDEIFVVKKYGTYCRNIEGFIEHSYYHLGQISLINKLIQLGTLRSDFR